MMALDCHSNTPRLLPRATFTSTGSRVQHTLQHMQHAATRTAAHTATHTNMNTPVLLVGFSEA